ncbi:cell adhesion molecule 2-like [Dendronephthya gigantea]|uniref:cell adhesion molecule 2-like n=1 Tax=Dendronephthya gigantea TaxID=151771 RepID=UPI00106D8411|nr:cell adhesion molecule 2-like [Dendronephthya gigantea]
MAGFGSITVFCLILVLRSCQGRITSPPDGKILTLFNGSAANITWSFDNDVSTVSSRVWYFRSSDGVFNDHRLGRIIDNDPPSKITSLLDVAIERPGTLLLKNVNQTYDGTYQFSIDGERSTVAVYIAKKPKVTLNCPGVVTLKKGENFTCLCRGEGGNPPANVTWYKDGVKITDVGTERQKLILSLVGRTVRGTYKCVATSHPFGKYSDEKFIQVIIYFKPTNTMITFTKNPAVINGPLTITCASDGFPEPFYTIYHNGKVLSTEKWYIVPQVKWKDNGTYKCIAANTFGKDSVSDYLKVTEEPKPTVVSITRSTSRSVSSTSIKNREEKAHPAASNDNETKWYIVLVSLLSGIIIGILLSYIVFRYHSKFRNKKLQQKPDSPTSQVDPTYQELDLEKMNKEDNYQSLRVNAARNDGVNDGDSTYTELNKTRDVDSNYQSLT